ncbi:hypothetical protein JTE90_014408 [Oedothorax gibbosus]|uniref:SF4 helicase domain-containing protein n=2 Tax=Oedothorax gibbosus TaxID=931172 RepID=A0AAV6UHH0_9ARAC|nr:hypothetical protein JTE90_014408 [Oedothorax gibbosus]
MISPKTNRKTLYLRQKLDLKESIQNASLPSKLPSLHTTYRFCSGVAQNKIEVKHLFESLSHSFNQAMVLDDLESNDLVSVSEKFSLKGLDIKYIHKYNIKVSSDLKTMLFPFDTINKDFSSIQFMTYKNDIVGERLVQDASPNSSSDILFGWSLVGQNQRSIVITSDPLDAIAVNQETDIPAVSLPFDFVKFSPQILNSLKTFKKIIFWLKPELHDWETHKTLRNSLQKSAFFIRSQDFPNALRSLQFGSNIKHILKEAYSLYDEDLETFDSYIDVILDDIKGHEKNSGMKWKRFTVLNDLLKGHRKGELTVFSGQTGTGKTTFMSEYSLDLCIQGLPTLWASFEITNTRLMKTMLSQFSRCSLVDNVDSYGHWAEEFRKIPMFFLNFHGPRTLKRILKAMANAVIVYNVQHIVIDNLQFMMNMEDYSASLDQLRRQDQVFGAFREFASRWNCHVTLVIHPRKEPEFSELSNTSISGTAKATQEADNIILLQTTKNRQYLQVTKNRFDGHKGCVIVEFDKKTQTFSVKNMSSKPKDQEKNTIL